MSQRVRLKAGEVLPINGDARDAERTPGWKRAVSTRLPHQAGNRQMPLRGNVMWGGEAPLILSRLDVRGVVE